jgi:hypothetical protein
MGLHISKRQVVRLLSEGLDVLVAEDQAVFRTGLETARWISVDDTSARHAGQDGFVTQLSDKRFTVFRTACTKSRRTILSLLQAGRTDYVVNDAALTKMRNTTMAAPNRPRSPSIRLNAFPTKPPGAPILKGSASTRSR